MLNFTAYPWALPVARILHIAPAATCNMMHSSVCRGEPCAHLYIIHNETSSPSEYTEAPDTIAIDTIVHGATYHQLYRVTDERAWLLYSSLQRYIAMQSRERYTVTALQRYSATALHSYGLA